MSSSSFRYVMALVAMLSGSAPALGQAPSGSGLLPTADGAHGCAPSLGQLLGSPCVCTSRGRRATTLCDNDGDGVAEYRIAQRLNDDGRVRSEKTYLGGASEPERCARFRYDGQGRLVAESSDEGCDGKLDHRAVYRFGDDGRPLSEWGDTDGDGEANYTVQWRYDAGGARTQVAYRYDPDEQLPDTTCRYAPPCHAPFDACWTTEQCWEGDRPAPSPRRHVTAALVEERGLAVCDQPNRCDGRTEVCGCDAEKRWVFSASDLDGDGLVDEYRVRTWHEDGSFTEAVDIGADGIEDR